jgi:hypothetical protein
MESVYTTALDYAAQTGRLDFLSAALTVLTVLLGVGGALSYFVLRSDVRARAEEAARDEAGRAVREFLSTNGPKVIREALDDAEVVARLQVEFSKLGLDDTETAALVDDDPRWKPRDE